MLKRRIVCLISGVVCLLVAGQANALNVQTFRPSTGHVQGFQLQTSETLPKYHLAVGTYINYAHQPLEQTAGGTSRIAGIVDHLVTEDFVLSYGATDWLTFNLGVPLHLYHDIAPTLIPARDKGGADFGDILLSAKFRLYDANSTKTGLGLAFVPFVSFQTGNETNWVGDANMTGGATLVGDWQFKSNRLFLNVGARFREKETVFNLNVDHELTYGLGYQRPLSKEYAWDVIGEVFGATTFDKFATEDISSPLEGIVTIQKKWGKNRNLITHVGGGAAITNGWGLPNYRVYAGISYAWDLKKKRLKKPEIINISEQIHFEFDKAIIKQKSYHVLDEVAAILKQHKDIAVVEIEGHTDSIGNDAYNLRLSQRRANAIKKYLVQRGHVDGSRLKPIGYGETRPIASNATDEGRAQNRRSVFSITYKLVKR